jgi:hypothetical protein
MARNTPYYDDEPKGGGGGAPAGGGGGGGRGNPNVSANTIAVRNADKNKTSTADEQIKVDKLLQAKREIEAAKAKPERKEAESKATTREESGVKITEYPYAGKNEFKKGGTIRTASSRADGIAARGKTRGKIS